MDRSNGLEGAVLSRDLSRCRAHSRGFLDEAGREAAHGSFHSTRPPVPTIHTVAERAGVSKSLVSLVLRGSPKVSPDRRAAVQRAIAELGYRPNIAARTCDNAAAGRWGCCSTTSATRGSSISWTA